MSSGQTGPQPRILIVKPSSLGDIVHALPVLAALRAEYPRAYIAWLAGKSFCSLLDGHPMLDEVILFDRARYGHMWYNPRASLDFWSFIRGLRQRRFDLVVDLQGLIRSGLMAAFSGARNRIGFADAREGAWLFYTNRVRSPSTAEHAVKKNLAVASALGLDVKHPAFPLAITEPELASAHELLTRSGIAPDAKFTAIIPGARWDSKQWPAERWGELITRLDVTAAPPCAILGGPGDRRLCDEILSCCQVRVADLVGRTNLRELTALISLSEMVICQDSGPMHIAAALDKPTIALFGPTNPARTGPYSPAARVISHAVECAPCFDRKCPLGHHECLRGVTVDRVLDEVQALASARVAKSADTVAQRNSP